MTSYVTPLKNTAFIMYASLPSQANPNIFQSTPTLASGDFKVSIDGGALANLTTLPTVTPAAGKMIKISLSSSEMNGDNITVVCSDVAGAEWRDVTINIQTSVRQIDDLAYPTVSGRSLDVSATGEAGIDWANIGSPSTSVGLSGTIVGGANVVRSATAQAGASTSITLDASASAVDSFYNGTIIYILTGTGAGQARIITGYVGSTKVATVTPAWITNPSATSGFAIIPQSYVLGVAAGAITNASFTAGAIDATAVADGAIDAATFAAGAINAAAIAADAITDAKVASDVTIASVTGSVGSVTGNVGGNVVGSVASVTAGVVVTTNNDKTGYGLSAAAIQAIWDALTSALTTVGSIGKLLVTNVDTTISSRLATSGYTAPTNVSAATIATAVWNEATSGHTTAGTYGQALQIIRQATAQAGAAGTITLDASASATDSFYNGAMVFLTGGTGAGQVRKIVSYVGSTKVATVQPSWTTTPGATSVFMILPDSHASLTANAVQSIWDALTSALTTVGSIGKLIVDNLNATISSRMATFTYTAPDNTTITAINAKTTNLPASPAAVSDIPTAAANATAVLDATIAEPSAVFAWSGSLRTIIGYLGALSRNKMTQTATTTKLRNDADSADIATSVVSDDGTTFTRGEYS